MLCPSAPQSLRLSLKLFLSGTGKVVDIGLDGKQEEGEERSAKLPDIVSFRDKHFRHAVRSRYCAAPAAIDDLTPQQDVPTLIASASAALRASSNSPTSRGEGEVGLATFQGTAAAPSPMEAGKPHLNTYDDLFLRMRVAAFVCARARGAGLTDALFWSRQGATAVRRALRLPGYQLDTERPVVDPPTEGPALMNASWPSSVEHGTVQAVEQDDAPQWTGNRPAGMLVTKEFPLASGGQLREADGVWPWCYNTEDARRNLRCLPGLLLSAARLKEATDLLTDLRFIEVMAMMGKLYEVSDDALQLRDMLLEATARWVVRRVHTQNGFLTETDPHAAASALLREVIEFLKEYDMNAHRNRDVESAKIEGKTLTNSTSSDNLICGLWDLLHERFIVPYLPSTEGFTASRSMASLDGSTIRLDSVFSTGPPLPVVHSDSWSAAFRGASAVKQEYPLGMLLIKVDALLSFLRTQQHLLVRYPQLTFQLARNEPGATPLAVAADDSWRLRVERRPHFSCANKPQYRSPCVLTLPGHRGPVKAADWSPDGKQVVSGSSDGRVRVWSVVTGELLVLLDAADAVEVARDMPRQASPPPVPAKQLSQSRRGRRGSIERMPLPATALGGSLEGGGKEEDDVRAGRKDAVGVTAVAVIPSYIRDPSTDEEFGIASPGSLWRWVAIGCSNGDVLLWDVVSMRVIIFPVTVERSAGAGGSAVFAAGDRSLPAHAASVTSIAWHWTKEYVVSGDASGVCTLWDIRGVLSSATPSMASPTASRAHVRRDSELGRAIPRPMRTWQAHDSAVTFLGVMEYLDPIHAEAEVDSVKGSREVPLDEAVGLVVTSCPSRTTVWTCMWHSPEPYSVQLTHGDKGGRMLSKDVMGLAAVGVAPLGLRVSGPVRPYEEPDPEGEPELRSDGSMLKVSHPSVRPGDLWEVGRTCLQLVTRSTKGDLKVLGSDSVLAGAIAPLNEHVKIASGVHWTAMGYLEPAVLARAAQGAFYRTVFADELSPSAIGRAAVRGLPVPMKAAMSTLEVSRSLPSLGATRSSSRLVLKKLHQEEEEDDHKAVLVPRSKARLPPKTSAGPRPILQDVEGKLAISAAVSRTGRVAAGYEDRSIRVWRVWDGKRVGLLYGHGDRVNCVVYSPDGQRIVSGSDDCSIRVWEPGRLPPGISISAHKTAVTRVVFPLAHTVRRAATVSKEGVVKVWNTITARTTSRIELQGAQKHLTGLQLVEAGSRLLVYSAAGLHSYTLDVGPPTSLDAEDDSSHNMAAPRGKHVVKEPVVAHALSPTGTAVAVATGDGTGPILLADLVVNKVVDQFPAPQEYASSPSSGGLGGKSRCPFLPCSAHHCPIGMLFTGDSSAVRVLQLGFHPTAAILIVVCSDGAMRLYKLPHLHSLQALGAPITPSGSRPRTGASKRSRVKASPNMTWTCPVVTIAEDILHSSGPQG